MRKPVIEVNKQSRHRENSKENNPETLGKSATQYSSMDARLHQVINLGGINPKYFLTKAKPASYSKESQNFKNISKASVGNFDMNKHAKKFPTCRSAAALSMHVILILPIVTLLIVICL